MPDVGTHIPFVVVVLQQTEGSNMLRSACRADLLQHLSEGLNLPQLAVVTIVIVQNAVPVDLGAEGSRTPTEEGDKVRSVCD